MERSPALPKTLPWEAGTQPEWGAPNLKAQGFPTGDRPDPDTESEALVTGWRPSGDGGGVPLC